MLRVEGVEASPPERQRLAMVLEDELAAIAPQDGDRWFEALPEDQDAKVTETVGAAQVD